jgi:broad specificity phosphatase PhoE
VTWIAWNCVWQRNNNAAGHLRKEFTQRFPDIPWVDIVGFRMRHSWELHRGSFEDWTLHNNWGRRPEGGESFIDIQNRFLPFIKSLTHDGLHTNYHVLCVGHGGLLQLMLSLVLTNINNDFVRSHGMAHTDCIIAELHAEGFP